MLSQSEIVEQTRAEVRLRLEGQGAGHGFDHVERVLASARLIQSEAGGCSFVIELAVLLHDVGDAKFHEGVERSAEMSREILGRLGVDEAIVKHVAEIVDNISFRKRATAKPLSLEGKVVQDADRLDALGAIGIVRTIEYGAFRNQPFYDPSHPDAPSGLQHFDDKLFKLRDLLHTDVARRIADERVKFMRAFVDQFLSECNP